MPMISEEAREKFVQECTEILRRVHIATGEDAAAMIVEGMRIYAYAIKAALGDAVADDTVIAAVAGELGEVDATTMAVLGIQKRKRDFT